MMLDCLSPSACSIAGGVPLGFEDHCPTATLGAGLLFHRALDLL